MSDPRTSDGRSAIVVGAGLGGLAVSTALAQRGWRVQVFERAEELRMFGAGIWLWANGLRALENIGAYDAVMAANGLRASAWEIRGRNRRLIRRRVCTPEDPLYVPRRADLYNALIDAATAAGVSIRCNARVVSADPDGSVKLQDGTTISADLVVASDGVRSSIREGLELTKELRETGFGLTRLLVPRDQTELGDDIASENHHGARAFLYNPCTPDETYLCLGAPITDSRANQRPIDVALWQEEFPEWAHVIERAAGVATHWDELTTVCCHAWSAGRVAIIGDAAHALPPTLGQAANLAFGNAVALAGAVSRVRDPAQLPMALKEWERIMRPLTDHTQKWSELYSKVAKFWPADWELAKVVSARCVLRLPTVERKLNLAARTPVEF